MDLVVSQTWNLYDQHNILNEQAPLSFQLNVNSWIYKVVLVEFEFVLY